MDELTLRWEKAKLPQVFYHTTFIDNVPLILEEQRIIANKGNSICQSKNRFISLSDRITKGIIEFFGNVILEFDAISLYKKNRLIVPKNYGSSSDIRKYDEVPLFENEWFIRDELKFDLQDINKVLLITNWKFGIRESSFKGVIKLLKSRDIEYIFLSERSLSDNIVTDMASYLLRIRGWKHFKKVAAHV
ncbi:MAG TPA: hypothetical protein DDW17_07370 [Deltaproteobacteria bacterium]|nr:hypothetical protein [Deltaproteobacteria bacterium]